MNAQGETINHFLVEVFHEILKTEERALEVQRPDLSVREFHLIEEVCRAVDQGLDNRATAIAAAQHITAGTLTTAVNALEKKGYLERHRDSEDRRAVRICPTEKGRQANELHTEFHKEMVENVLCALNEEESLIFVRALGSVAEFFRQKYAEKENRRN